MRTYDWSKAISAETVSLRINLTGKRNDIVILGMILLNTCFYGIENFGFNEEGHPASKFSLNGSGCGRDPALYSIGA